MTKKEFRTGMTNNASFTELAASCGLKKRDGQECEVFKGVWPVDVKMHLDDVIYVPDLGLNDLSDLVGSRNAGYDDIQKILSECYTVRDFLIEGLGNVRLAKKIFDFVDWQHPDLQDVRECYPDDDDARENFGEPWSQIDKRAENIAQMQKELYNIYTLRWMAENHKSVEDVVAVCRDLAEDAEDPDDIDFDEAGFDGEMYVCFAEFLGAEYQDPETVESCIDQMSIDNKAGIIESYIIDTGNNMDGAIESLWDDLKNYLVSDAFKDHSGFYNFSAWIDGRDAYKWFDRFYSKGADYLLYNRR